MFGPTLQAALTILVAASLATYVQLRAAQTPLRGPLLALLGALAVWSGGVILRYSARTEPDVLGGMLVTWLGVANVPALWMLLAARWARVRALERRPGLAVVLFVPALLTWLSLATSPWHGLFFREISVHAPPERGPLFYAYLVYAYGMITGGIALYLARPLRGEGAPSYRESVTLAVAALLPMVVSALYIARLLPVPYDPTPGSLAISLGIFVFGVFRYQLLDALPLARGDAIDHLREALLIADAGGVVIDANRSAALILGLAVPAERPLHLRDALAPLGADADALAALEERFEALAPDAGAPTAELRSRDGRRIEVSIRCLRAPGGGVLGRLAVLRDRTEEHRHEDLLRQSQKLETVGRLVAGVAHEVNNPLAFVRSNLNHLERVAQDAQKRLADGDRAAAAELAELPAIVAECLDGIDRIKRIVDAMRRFSRPPGEEFAPLDVNEVVRVALRLAELRRSERVAVETELAPGLPPVLGSATRLEQVALNLLVNAKQALEARDGGRIAVRTRLAGDIVQLEVSDDGPGIPEEHRERIFDPFFTTKGPEQGTGLGLSIAYDIVREHGGVLELRSRGDGGACFVAHLPRLGG
jgi:signal transduction histidine kinase